MFDMKANNVKVGDKLIDTKGHVWTVKAVDDSKQPCFCSSEEVDYPLWFYDNGFSNFGKEYEIAGFAPEPIEEPEQTANKPHKYKDLIIAYANGAEIEYYRRTDNEWYGTSYPGWYEHKQYRIKPEPKPDVVKYLGLEYDFDEEQIAHGEFRDRLDCVDHWNSQIKVTFDAHTGKVKSAEVIN